ncbi:JAB domain-containing protein [Flavisolibacter nicotianae]|uniref:JAB domain-containing protein n=1 Tax=Flavisolibacter nicotianae TaxID=2364882 RepID=UPI0013C3F7EB|nr:JAB domain-containing protein [Flavisolibacter nicotianae]
MYPTTPEIVLGNVPEVEIPELQVSYNRSSGKFLSGPLTEASGVADFIRSTIGLNEVELQEQFIVLYLSQSNHVIGYYKHSKGSINATVADIRIILGTALKCAAISMIVAHNHPSGNLKPSRADEELTRRLKEAATLHDIKLLDHLIITKEGHLSFANEGLLGLEGLVGLADVHDKFVAAVTDSLLTHTKHNKISLEKLAASFGIKDKTEVKELTELAIVKRARKLAWQGDSVWDRFLNIVNLYNSQVNLSHRTSQSILLQQYSTPAPIAYLAGVFCGLDQMPLHQKAFEPSAGNGMLTIAGKPECFEVNEIDPLRNSNLHRQGFFHVMQEDATRIKCRRVFDAVLTNPPFGKMDLEVLFDTFPIKTLEHVMALRALECLKDSGKAAIIIGGHTSWDEKGRIQAGKNRIFFNYLYSRYNVMDVINIDGHKLYSRQGTSFDVRLILIDGRKEKPSGAAPVYNPYKDKVVTTFNELYERVMDATKGTKTFTPHRPEKDLYNKYLSIKSRYPDAIILIRSENEYKIFGDDALELARNTDLLIAGEFVIDEKKVRLIKFPHHSLPYYQNLLTKAGYKLAIADELTLPPMTSVSELEKEAQMLQHELEREALELQKLFGGEGLGAPYEPASEACVVLNTQVPDSMAFETRQAILTIKREVGGDIDNFVRHRLKYPTKTALCKVLSAEQIDAVAMAIYNIEARGQGMIIGDQTGIGKGRVAAAMIRYAVVQGHKPVFLTEKANLFSDIYRDLSAIGSSHLRPFIVNGREPKTDIKDEDGEVVYTAPPPTEQHRVFQDLHVPANYDFVVATYSQFNSPEKKPEKPAFLSAIADNNIFILDEAHNSSGSSNTGEFLQKVVANTKGVVFLSATFAKRPDNMPIYAMKTSIADCNMSRDDLVDAITRGGVALQEILSSQLVAEGQMVRRERSFEGVEVNYINLDAKAEEHKAIADNITEILRSIISFQGEFINKEVEELDKIAVAEGKEVDLREGTSQAGVDNQPYFSKVFQVINQMLFSLKAEAVAERTIQRLKEGKKPVIAFASTMGSFIEGMENEHGMPVSDGDTINADFTEVLMRGLDGVLRFTEKDVNGQSIHKRFALSDLSQEAQAEYHRIYNRIQNVSTGITISPIDVIITKLKAAGYSVAEVTGRKYEVQLNLKTGKGLVLSRRRINTNDAFRQFNNNEVDVLMINQSGSTGASAHAIPTAKVPKDQVRQRVMIVLQAELDINTEVQKRGRINRTGQILKPIYDYMTSAIPAEKRLMMMLQKKLKSLDANTASNQKQSNKILDVPDFLNKYGDKVVKEYLVENKDVNALLDDPLKLEDSKADSGSMNESATEDAAHKVSGRVAVLSTKMQQDFYNEISERYNDYVDYLKQVGEYDLEVEAMNLEAETVGSKVIKIGKGSDSAFGDDSNLETVRANVLKKPFTKSEVENMVMDALKGVEPKTQQAELIQQFGHFNGQALEAELAEVETKYKGLILAIPDEKAMLKIQAKQGEGAYLQACAERRKELETARELKKAQTHRVFENRRQYLMKMFSFYYVGRGLNYPIETYQGGNELVPAIFVGFVIDGKKKNPYAPSAIKLRFAIANSSKYLAIPASYSEDIMAIIGASVDVPEHSLPVLLTQWEEYTNGNNVDRRIRHIITGNLLQAFSDFKGKLVSYTTNDGQTKKGILMPENWNPTEQVQDKVVVPILKALPLIKSLQHGGHIVTNNGLSIFKQGTFFRLIVSASRVKGGDIYLDRQLLELVQGGNFEKTSDKMVALVPDTTIDKAVEVLQNNHSLSVTIHSYQLKDLKADAIRIKNRKPILLPDKEEDLPVNNVLLLELEAEALALELELLAA